LKVDDKIEESLMIADSIAKKLKSSNGLGCVQLLQSFDYVLLNTPMPAVSIEFGVLLPSKNQAYVLDAAFQDKTAQSLASAIKEYADLRTPKTNQ
jgi:N-acetylmuramoyl-L-alanine amidase